MNFSAKIYLIAEFVINEANKYQKYTPDCKITKAMWPKLDYKKNSFVRYYFVQLVSEEIYNGMDTLYINTDITHTKILRQITKIFKSRKRVNGDVH